LVYPGSINYYLLVNDNKRKGINSISKGIVYYLVSRIVLNFELFKHSTLKTYNMNF